MAAIEHEENNSNNLHSRRTDQSDQMASRGRTLPSLRSAATPHHCRTTSVIISYPYIDMATESHGRRIARVTTGFAHDPDMSSMVYCRGGTTSEMSE
jgi:hypothetical protein